MAPQAKRRDNRSEQFADSNLEEIEENGMPLKSYILMHKEARLSEEQRNILALELKELSGHFEE